MPRFVTRAARPARVMRGPGAPGTGSRAAALAATALAAVALAAGVPRAVVIGHFSLALTGLGIWIGFLATGQTALAWAAVGVVLAVAGLGMATLAGGLPEGHQASGGPPGEPGALGGRPARGVTPRAEPGGGPEPAGHAGVVAGDFSGEVASFYARYRRGYPAAFVGLLARALRLGTDALVADVGCGTGQLTIPLAGRARAVVGIDPEPDMLALAARAAAEQRVTNVLWMLGSDDALPALAAVAGGPAVDAVTVANAIHLLPEQRLFTEAATVLRPGGGIAVIANGTPLWQQPSDWSLALRRALEQWLGTRLESCCGTDQRSRQRYREAMLRAGLTGIREEAFEYSGDLSVDQVIGGIYSALPARLLPSPGERPAFAARIRGAIGAAGRFTEQVRVAALIGYRP